MNASVDLSSSKFWAKFKKHYWEKKPIAFKKPRSTVFQINAESTFDFLLRYSEHCRKNKVTDGLKLYVNSQLQYETELIAALPTQKDKSLLGYHKRLAKIYDDYCLVCDELSQGSGEEWHLIKEFLRPLYKQVGIPNKYAEMGLYLGNYKKTPFGVHVDGCGVFSFPVIGMKKFRLWEPGFVQKNPDLKESFRYEGYLKKSELIEVGPGDLSYWPSTTWHIAESDGNFSATWSLGLWLNEPFADLVVKELKNILIEKLKTDSFQKSMDYDSQSFPRPPQLFLESIRRIKELSETDLEDTFTRSWLKSKSKMGFKSPPLPRRNIKLKSSHELSLNSEDSLPWGELSNGLVVIAVNGSLFDYKKTSSLLRLLNKINGGESVVFGKYTGSEARLLQKLYENFGLSLN